MLKVNRRSSLWLASVILFLTLTVLSGIVIEYYWNYQSIPSKHLIGNSISNLKNSKEDGFPFSFLVIGDTRGSETAERLIEMALEKGTTSFMVILGDFVRKPDIWNHRFFLTEMTTEINLPFPVFLVSGNYDIDDTGEVIKQTERRVTSEVYESFYGAKDFDFVFNNCLFIICDNNYPRNRSSYLSYLRETLSKKGEGKQHIFVFMHCPPRGLAKHISGEIPDEEFFTLVESYKVTACFFGHYHGYWRGQRKGVNLIVSGGGGGHLKPSRWGAFHHILKVTVWQDKVSEEIITIQGQNVWEDRFEEWVFTHLLPIIRDRVWILYFLVFLFLSWDIYSAICFVNSLKKEINKNLKSGYI
jgi:Icc-related predicted phosphoesterase